MSKMNFFAAGDSAAIKYAVCELKKHGVIFTSSSENAQIILYNIPTPAFLRDEIPAGYTILGGNLDFLEPDIHRIDLLKDSDYLALNAALTAEAALGLLLPHCDDCFSSSPVLILGWGRIGKCLAKMMKALGFPVSIYARKQTDRSMIRALGYQSLSVENIADALKQFRFVVNTIPSQVISDSIWSNTSSACVKMDLASVQSIPGSDVIHARGLPGKHKPKASGALIAKTILRTIKEVE